MSTFDGLIREFPTVAIDNFRIRSGVSIYFLSHVHSDHLTGLASKTWSSHIFCSYITAKWLPMLATRSSIEGFESGNLKSPVRKYSHLKPFLKPLSTDTPHYLDLGNGRNARISLIPAHHCPGAVMFFIQDDSSSILYTGDARNELLDLQALSNWSVFSPSAQKIDRLYLDTTYCHQDFLEIPGRDSVISDLIVFVNQRPRLAHYYIDTWTFGYEDIWIALSKAFQSKIHVSAYLYSLYEAIDDLVSPKILPHLTTDGSSARFHSCRLGSSCRYGGVGENATSRELIRIQPNVVWFSHTMSKMRQQQQQQQDPKYATNSKAFGQKCVHSFKTKEKLPSSISKKDDLFYYINYGFHASLSELRQLVEIVSPKAIFPCVLHRDPIFHSFYSSNRESLALLAQSMPQRSFSLDVEKEIDRRPCFSDAISTDFQSFHKAKGFNVLDMGDNVLGEVTFSERDGSNNEKRPDCVTIDGQERRADIIGSKSATFISLSPRSKHLQRKMEKLKRQLRSTASLEERANGTIIEDEESVFEEGPLSLDLQEIERKRRWWLEFERGKSTTQEENTTNEDVTDPHISRVSIDGVVENPSINDKIIQPKQQHGRGLDWEKLPKVEGEEKGEDQLHEMSTLELNDSAQVDCTHLDANLDVKNITSPPKTYLSSSPDSINLSTSSRSLRSNSLTAQHEANSASPIHDQTPLACRDCPSPESIAKNIHSSVPPSPNPSVQSIQSHDCISISSDESAILLPFNSHHHPTTNTQPILPRAIPCKSDTKVNHGGSRRLERSTTFYDKYRPANNIYVQLAWSPPLKPLKLSRRLSDVELDQGWRTSSRLTTAKRGSSTIIVDEKRKEIIVIESSEDEEVEENSREYNIKSKKLKSVEI